MKALIVAAALIAGLAGMPGGAKAHSFNVGLVIALSEQSDANIRQARDGFLLATRERDSHPDEESDGHLGGLDVYLFPVDLKRESLAGIRALLQREQIDILAVIGPDDAADQFRPLVAGSKAVLLAPGRLASAPNQAFANPKLITRLAESMRPSARWAASVTARLCGALWTKPGTGSTGKNMEAINRPT
jgi:hypothetical protein